PHQDWQVARQWRGAKVLVHGVETSEHGAKVVWTDGEQRRQADGWVHRVAATDPIPEPEHVCRVDAEFAYLRRIGRDGDEMLRHCLGVTESPQSPVTGGVCVGHGFKGREGLRGEDEQRLSRIEVAGGLGGGGAVDVSEEPESDGNTG